MKIEIGESLGYSFLRHVKGCWLVQTNWKASEHWETVKTSEELEAMFLAMKQRFDRDGSVFKQTKNASQFLKQGEIDVLGVDRSGGVHALEVAFHEAGLNYGNTSETDNRVLKKLLRTMMILNAFQPHGAKLHINFASPKVNPVVQEPLEKTLKELETEYPQVDWNLIANDDFTNSIVLPTLEKAVAVADTSELFVRSTKLLGLSDMLQTKAALPAPSRVREQTITPRIGNGRPEVVRGKLQPLVSGLMKTLLEDHPTLLDTSDRSGLLDPDYCKRSMGLKIGNFALLRNSNMGRHVSGHSRYWAKQYAGEFYVCSEWGKSNHLSNAQSLLRFVTELAQRQQEHPGIHALEEHVQALHNYIGTAD